MSRTRIKLAVYVDLDPMPGTFHSAESARNAVNGLLHQNVPHYKPLVSIEIYDTSKPHAVPPADGLLEGVLDELQEARLDMQQHLENVIAEPNEPLQKLLDLIDQIAEERARYIVPTKIQT